MASASDKTVTHYSTKFLPPHTLPLSGPCTPKVSMCNLICFLILPRPVNTTNTKSSQSTFFWVGVGIRFKIQLQQWLCQWSREKEHNETLHSRREDSVLYDSSSLATGHNESPSFAGYKTSKTH